MTVREKTDAEIEKLEKKLTEIYGRASDEITEKAKKYFDSYSKEDAEMRKKMEGGEISKSDYIEWQKRKMLTGRRWVDFSKQVNETLANVSKVAVDIVNGKLPEVYSLSYNEVGGLASNTVKGFSFSLINPDAVVNLAKSDKTLLPYKTVDGKKEERWNTKQVNAEVMQGLLQGESIDKIAKRLRNVTEMDRRSSIRNARTTINSAENKGTFDGLKRIEKDGLIVKKAWLATHDGKARDSHLEFEALGPIDLEEEFAENLMYPSDPDGDPSEVYNCRCSLESVIVGYEGRYFDEQKEGYYKEVKLDRLDDDVLGEINQYFKELDDKYKARVEDVVTTLQRDQEEWDKEVASTALSFMKQNPKMRKSTAYKRAIEICGERPTSTDIFLGGDYLGETGMMTMNVSSISRSGGVEQDIEARARRIERNKQRISEGKSVRSNGNVGETHVSTFLHEYGHAIDYTYGVSENEKFLDFYNKLSEDQIENGLSSYATTNEREFIAEAFAESFMGETQGDLSKDFMKILEEIVNGNA